MQDPEKTFTGTRGDRRFTSRQPVDLRMSPGQKIIQVAERWVNLHEVAANAAWDDLSTPGEDQRALDLRDAMRASGWQEGWSYCAALVEAVWRTAYVELGAPIELLLEISRKLTPSVMQSFRNWEGSISLEPEPGAIFFMQLGSGWQGHAGIVVRRGIGKVATIEGNTSPDPATPEADREGDGVFRRVRTLDFKPRPGLWMRGFLNPLPLG